MSITAQVIMLFCIVLVGTAARKLDYLNDATIQGVTKLVVNITVPCLMISNMQRPFDVQVLKNFLITLILSAAFILAVMLTALRVFKNRPHKRLTVMANLLGFSNCGFMGYPIILAVNPGWMMYAVAYNVSYTVITWTLGACLYQGRENMSLKKAVLHPNVMAALIGFALFCARITLPSIPGELVSTLGGLTTPLTMLLIGTRLVGLRLGDFKDPDYHIIAFFRLVGLPLLIFGMMKLIPASPDVAGTLFLLTAMPCGTMTAMQAELYGGDSVFASRAIAYSTLLALLTVPVMSMLL